MPGRLLVLAALVGTTSLTPQAQERKVPADSARISIPGCARNRVFIVGVAPEHEPVNNNVQPGRRFRLSGNKKVLADIKAHQGQMVEVTGLVRRSDLADPGGLSLGGGRVRIGGGPPRDPMGDVTRNPGVSQAVIDVEGWRPIAGDCPTK